MNKRIVKRHLEELSYVYVSDVAEDFGFFIVRGFNLPPGYNKAETGVWVELLDYPESPPGVGGSHVYVEDGLRFRGRRPADYHEGTGPAGWAWWCYEWIQWNPCRDNLITFLEVVRAHMTNPD